MDARTVAVQVERYWPELVLGQIVEQKRGRRCKLGFAYELGHHRLIMEYHIGPGGGVHLLIVLFDTTAQLAAHQVLLGEYMSDDRRLAVLVSRQVDPAAELIGLRGINDPVFQPHTVLVMCRQNLRLMLELVRRDPEVVLEMLGQVDQAGVSASASFQLSQKATARRRAAASVGYPVRQHRPARL